MTDNLPFELLEETLKHDLDKFIDYFFDKISYSRVEIVMRNRLSKHFVKTYGIDYKTPNSVLYDWFGTSARGPSVSDYYIVQDNGRALVNYWRIIQRYYMFLYNHDQSLLRLKEAKAPRDT